MRSLIKFHILLDDKDDDVTLTLLMVGLPSYIRVTYKIQIVNSNFHLPWKAFRIRSNRHLNIVNKTKALKYSKTKILKAPCSSECVSSGSLPGSSDIFEQYINRDNVLCALCHIAKTIFSEMLSMSHRLLCWRNLFLSLGFSMYVVHLLYFQLKFIKLRGLFHYFI